MIQQKQADSSSDLPLDTKSSRTKEFDALWGGQIIMFDFDLLSSTIQLKIHVNNMGEETRFRLSFLGVSKLEYARKLLSWDYVELTSIYGTETSHSETAHWLIEMELWASANINVLCEEWYLEEIESNRLTLEKRVQSSNQ